MTTKLTAKNKLEALNTINQAITLCNLAADGIIFSIGKTESAKLSELESVNWNDLRLLLKNLDSTTFYYEIEKGVKADIDCRWNDSTQRLTIQSLGDTQQVEVTEEVSQVLSDTPENVDLVDINSSFTIPPTPEVTSTTVKTQYTSNKALRVWVAAIDSEKKEVRIPLDLSPIELFSTIKPWLAANDKVAEFRKELKETKHNSIVIYLNSAYEWEIRKTDRVKSITLEDSFKEQTKEIRELNGWGEFSDDLFSWLYENWKQAEYNQAVAVKLSVANNGEFHLKTTEKIETSYRPFKKDVTSQYIAPIMNRAGSIIERKKREAVPIFGSLEGITPILVENHFLAQSYIVFNPSTLEATRETRKIAVQIDGKFYYYHDFSDKSKSNTLGLSEEDRETLEIYPVVGTERDKKLFPELEGKFSELEGKVIFPDLTINRVRFETLDPDGATLKLEHYNLTGVWIPKDQVTNEQLKYVTRSPITGEPITKFRWVNYPVNFLGFEHPNIKAKPSIRDESGKIAVAKEAQVIKPQKAKLVNLSDARSVATNSLEWTGFVSNVPSRVTLVNSTDHWQLEALPIRDIPTYPLLYVLAGKAQEMYWQMSDIESQIISPLDADMQKLEVMSEKTKDTEKLEKIGRRITDLQRLRAAVLDRKKLDPKILSECQQIVKNAMTKADYRPSLSDPYFSRYILGQVYFVQTNSKGMEYLLDDYMSHKRTATSVISAVLWLSLVPNHLKTNYPKTKPTLEEIKGLVYPKWNNKFSTEYKDLALDIRQDKGKIFFDVLHKGQIQVTQLLTPKMPAVEGKDRGKVSTKVGTTLNFSEREIFQKFLRTNDGRFVSEAQQTLRHLVNIFLSRSFNTLVGENKVGKQKKISEIIGFNRSKLGWSQIKNNFCKYLTPFTTNSEINKGKLVYLSTLKTLSTQDLESLVIKIAENWVNWIRKDQEYIKIGDSTGMTRDPQCLVWVLTQKILTGNHELDSLAWKDTINWMAEITRQSIGFRCSNGVILTPDNIYSSHLDKWEHRIKVQLVDLLLDSQSGSVEAWLQKSIDSLYSAIEKKDITISRDIDKHLRALHDSLNLCLALEQSKL